MAEVSPKHLMEIAAQAADHLTVGTVMAGGAGPEIRGGLSTVVAMVIISAMPGATDAQCEQAFDMVRRQASELLPTLRDGAP